MIRAILRRDFLLLWQGQVITSIGNQAFLIATMYWTMETTGSSTLMGTIMMLQSIPVVLLGPFAGTVSDWYSRKVIMVTSDVINGLAVLSLAGWMLFPPVGTADGAALQLTWLMAVVLLNGVSSAFFAPAISASIPDLVPEAAIDAANSATMFSRQAATLAGQALAGVAYRFVGAPVLFLIDGISYLLSAVSESLIRLPAVSRVPSEGKPSTFRGFLSDTRAGFDRVVSQPGAWRLLLVASGVNALVMPAIVLLPFHVESALGRGAAWYGFLLAAFSLGSVAGFLAVSVHAGLSRNRALVIQLAFIGAPLAIAVLGFTSSGIVALVLMVISGLCSGLVNVFVLSIFQIRTEPALRGRVMSLVYATAGAAAPLGMLAGGLIGDWTGHETGSIYAWSGIMAALLAGSVGVNPDYRRFLRAPSDDTSGYSN